MERKQLYVDEIAAPNFQAAMMQALDKALDALPDDWESILCPVKVDVTELEPVTPTSGEEG